MDRNLIGSINRAVNIMSLSARRAWIEIFDSMPKISDFGVALRKESVDRNTLPENPMVSVNGRSPQGERG